MEYSGLDSAYDSSRCLVFGGGSVFQSISSVGSLMVYLGIVGLARLFGCQVVVLSHGWGPFRFQWHQRLAHWVLTRSHVVRSWRDHMARDLFGELSDPVFCDLALLQARRPDARMFHDSSCIIGISLRSFMRDRIASISARFQTIGVVNQWNDEMQDDDIFLEDVWDVPPNIGLMITDRYHAAIWASKFGIPWIALSHDPKIVALAQDAQQLIFCDDDDDWYDQITAMMDNVNPFVPNQSLMDWYDSFANSAQKLENGCMPNYRINQCPVLTGTRVMWWMQ